MKSSAKLIIIGLVILGIVIIGVVVGVKMLNGSNSENVTSSDVNQKNNQNDMLAKIEDDSNNPDYDITGNYLQATGDLDPEYQSEIEISNVTNDSIDFSIVAKNIKYNDEIVGEVNGTAKKIEIPDDFKIPKSTQYAYEFEEKTDNGKAKIILVYTAHKKFEYISVGEEYTDNINPYSDSEVYFDGEYEKN